MSLWIEINLLSLGCVSGSKHIIYTKSLQLFYYQNLSSTVYTKILYADAFKCDKYYALQLLMLKKLNKLKIPKFTSIHERHCQSKK